MGFNHWLSRSWLGQNLFVPPYRLIPALMVLYLLLSVACHPSAAFWTHDLADPDDYMRLNEVVNWLQGFSWYDLSQPRLSPGEHTVIHWARLVDIPIALAALPLLSIMSMQNAAMTAAMIVPPLLFVLLVFLIPKMARPILGRRYANLAPLMLLASPGIVFDFTPGRVDHHAYSIMIAGFGLLALQNMLLCRGGWRSGIVAGMFFACGLWIGMEIMPPLLLTCGGLALYAAWRGGFALRNAAAFGVSLALATVTLLPLAVPVELWSDWSISWFSSATVIFSALTGAVFVSMWSVGRRVSSARLRLVLVSVATVVASMVYVALVSEVIAGPFASYYHFNSTTALDNIVEALPMQRKLIIKLSNHFTIIAAVATFIASLLAPLLALGVAGIAAYRAQARRRMLWIIYAVMVATTLLLAFFVQTRVATFLNLYQIVPLTFLIVGFWKMAAPEWPVQKRVLAGALSFLIIGPFIMFVPAALAAHIMAPVAGEKKNVTETCALRPVTDYLTSAPELVGNLHTVMAPMDDGPQLLFRTPYNVIGGNYNVAGNEDVFGFFSARDDAKSKAILQRWNVDIVVTCRRIALFYAGRERIKFGANTFIKQAKDGTLHLVSSLDHPTLIERLVEGNPPTWLKPVEIAGNKDYLVYQVQNDASLFTDEPRK